MLERTSVTDVSIYREFCYIASRNADVFKNFKRHPVMRWAVEYIKGEQGRDCLIKILTDAGFKLSVSQWRELLKNDLVGNPVVAEYNLDDGRMICSPTTLRYIKILSDIVAYFEADKIKRVAEIGVGYGGQCRILQNFLNIDEYNLIDLPEVLALAEKFLANTTSNFIGGGGKIHRWNSPVP